MRVFIGCSANEQIDNKYRDLACLVADLLASNGHKLVFGGDTSGMMGACFFYLNIRELKLRLLLMLNIEKI